MRDSFLRRELDGKEWRKIIFGVRFMYVNLHKYPVFFDSKYLLFARRPCACLEVKTGRYVQFQDQHLFTRIFVCGRIIVLGLHTQLALAPHATGHSCL